MVFIIVINDYSSRSFEILCFEIPTKRKNLVMIVGGHCNLIISVDKLLHEYVNKPLLLTSIDALIIVVRSDDCQGILEDDVDVDFDGKIVRT